MYQGCPAPGNDAPWLRNRSTLRDLGSLYANVNAGQLYTAASSTGLFKDLMINGSYLGSMADYGGTEISPITGKSHGPAYLPGYVTTIAEEVVDPAKFTIVDDFLQGVRYRKKGGGVTLARILQ